MFKRQILTLAAVVVLTLAGVNSASATPYGNNITVNDGSNAPGYHGISVGAEDDETEGIPNTYQSQDWDLEGMFLNGNLLTMIGGFKFDSGVKHGATWYTSGDILFDVAGTGAGWDYAIRMNFTLPSLAICNSNPSLCNATAWSYDVLKLAPTTTFFAPTDVQLSTPFKVNNNIGGSTLYSGLSFTFGLITDSGFSGWQTQNPNNVDGGDPHWQLGSNKHYQVGGFDLGFLGQGITFDTHFTMLCGNDLLLGNDSTTSTTTVPEPGSLFLIGLGLAGFAGYARKLRRK